MHKLGAVLAQAETIREGDKIHQGGRGPWRKVKEVRPGKYSIYIAAGHDQIHLPKGAFIRVVRG